MSAAPHRPAGIISSLYKPETERNAVAARKKPWDTHSKRQIFVRLHCTVSGR